jgi:hypothetical protein
MKKCPHCEASISPVRLMFSWRWTPHRCPSCQHYSEIPWLDLILLASLPSGILVVVIARILYTNFHGIGLVVAYGVSVVAAVFTIALLLSAFARFIPIPDPKHKL